ncbi:ImmA/IrrE family metallo-endopeptidase [Microbacterium plantarum]|uniref:ImmA/IrrE family metallo-endopeptidase n=1 Tax=Microbacterium plantarum TaxID=1816425 RepID=UPI0038992B1A
MTNRKLPKGSAYDPWEHADNLGVEVVTRPLRTAHGLWVAEHRTILIHSRLRAGAQRLILAHEIGHADLAHPDDRPKHERQADEYAAHNLICPIELEAAYKWCPDEPALISELGVTRRLFRAYVLSAA